MPRLPIAVLAGLLCIVASPSDSPAAQASGRAGTPGDLTTEGTVVSMTSNTLVVRTDEGQYELFVIDRYTVRPAKIPVGSRVSVAFTRDEVNGPSSADLVSVTMPPETPQTGLAEPAPDDTVPQSVRDAERSIQRQASRYRLGVRGGATLDPELVTFGVLTQLGPFFSENFWARPNVDFGFGEVTKMIGLNFEGAYRLPVTSRRSRWNVFLGGGPALNFGRRSFEDVESGQEIDFGDFELDVGLNLLLGVQTRSGFFMELRSTAWAAPHLRFHVGHTF